jgi:SAM-dependent methyltransferase
MNYTEITECRLCRSKDIKTVLDFGLSPLANSYPLSKNEDEKLYPLTVIKCNQCDHIQLKQTVDPKILFSEYSYSSSYSPTLVKHFVEYASTIYSYLNLQKTNSILEIGSNDGILLKELVRLGFRNLYGVEPAKNLSDKSVGDNRTIINSFFNFNSAQNILRQYGKMDAILANNVFAHLSDLDGVMQGIKLILNDNGVFIFENAYLLDTIKGLYFDQIYHEHLQYYGIKPLIQYLRTWGFEIFKIQRVNVQGGSFRIFVKFKNSTKHKQESSVKEFMDEEYKAGLYEDSTFVTFYERIYALKNQLTSLTSKITEENKSICCYGCPAKFALFSKFFGLSNKNISYVVDNSPLKQGKYSPGTKIPIVDNKYFIQNQTDYCIISAWNMADAIVKSNDYYTGTFIIPIPEIKLI